MESFPDDPLVMLVEDDPDQRALVGQWLRDEGMRTVECSNAAAFLDSLDLTLPDVVCLDLGLPGIDGRQALDAVQRQHPNIPVLMVTADASTQSVIDAMRSGASDYLTKPVDRETILDSVRRALTASEERLPTRIAGPAEPSSYAGILGRSPQMQEVFRQVDRIAGRDISVLVRGDSGTGKELIARAIHENSRRAGGPFVAINCAAIPESLQDSELFGHERGSFTGAHKARVGCFERADGGTLFLDEVAELSLAVQAKLLRVLQERRFNRVGGIRTVESDFRLVTATHRDLRALVEANRFREDLYFRIVVFEIELPALRVREGDLGLLVATVLEEIAASLGGGRLRVSKSAMQALESYPFPGNVRELENILQCAAVLAAGDEIGLRDLPARVRNCISKPSELPAPAAISSAGALSNGSEPAVGYEEKWEAPTTIWPEELPLNLEALERWAVKRALRDKNGRLTETAKALGIGRTTLYRKLEKYGLR